MTVTHPIVRRRAAISDALGLHMRPAARFVALAQRFSAEIRVRCNDAEADGKSVMALLCLAAEGGMAVDLEASGPDAERAVAALADLLSTPSPGVQGPAVARQVAPPDFGVAAMAR